MLCFSKIGKSSGNYEVGYWKVVSGVGEPVGNNPNGAHEIARSDKRLMAEFAKWRRNELMEGRKHAL